MKTFALNKPYYDEKGYDTYVADDENQVYAIYDGMGVSEGARYASMYCADQTSQLRQVLASADAPTLARTLDQFAVNIGNSSDGGTTGVIIHIDKDNVIHYAMMGDSRLYVFIDDKCLQIGNDEGVGNMLSNYIGKYSQGCQQWGSVPQWDKFMICSDGITGDWPDQFIDEKDMQAAFKLTSARDIGRQWMQLSKKPDDKTLIVGVKGE